MSLVRQATAAAVVDGIGHIPMHDGSDEWFIFITGGAIEKVAHGGPDDVDIDLLAPVFEEIAARKFECGQTTGRFIWVRSQDIPDLKTVF
jgi:hypothetical protein